MVSVNVWLLIRKPEVDTSGFQFLDIMLKLVKVYNTIK
jgi:hypothetical protein